jgi:hypothetical protein
MTDSLKHLFLLASLGLASVVHGDTINFNDANRGPGDSLQIGDVAVSPYGAAGGQVESAAGYGLGNTALGPGYEVDDVMNFLPTENNFRAPSSEVWSGLQFSVDGFINSITLLPVFQAYQNGTLLPDQSSFYIAVISFGDQEQLLNPSSGNPITFSGPDLNPLGTPISSLSLAVFFDMTDGNAGLLPYGQQDLSSTIDVQFGFTVVSMDITPAPEPATLALAALGLGSFLMFRRKTVA